LGKSKKEISRAKEIAIEDFMREKPIVLDSKS
jgi:hypothetical protein